MKIIKIVLSYFIAFGFIGCAVKKEIQEGKYNLIKAYGSFCELKLLPNNQFIMHIDHGLRLDSIYGLWYDKGKYVLLKKDENIDYSRFKVKEYNQPDNDSTISLELKDYEDIPLGLAFIAINDSINNYFDLDGKRVTYLSGVQKFKVDYLGIKSPEYHVKDTTSNYFKIYLKLDSSPEYPFDGAKLKKRRNNRLVVPKNIISTKSLKLKLEE